ncbi:MAG: FAD-dependent oxidoreductase [Planctomycetota bacterium]|nr:FAD-dependent oxidoreductase [Planctomycetota bacterium]
MEIAIIGAGISGLVAARELYEENELTIFESEERIGGHTHTVDVETRSGSYAIDTGFIVFNELNYPNFSSLLRELCIPTRKTTMSFSVRCDKSGLEYNGTTLNTIFSQRRNLLRPRFLGMLLDIMKFHRKAASALETGDDVSVADFARKNGLGAAFYEDYLVPLGSALWSSSADQFEGFPIRFVAEFMSNHQMLQSSGRPAWSVIEGGSRNYLEPISRPFSHRIRTGTPVQSVRREKNRVFIHAGDEPEAFDEVIFACHADQALRLLADPSELESEVLSSFPYQENDVVLHTDDSVLPRNRRAWAGWNYRKLPGETDRATVTYNMNMLQGIEAPETFCVSLNQDGLIDEKKVLRKFLYHHPVYDHRRAAAQSRHGELTGANNTSFCGAYWGYGFHEDGVNSALAVCRKLKEETSL